MKKRCFSCLLLLLITAMLLSSCAASGFTPSFFEVAGARSSTFWGYAKNLLSGNVPLLLNGNVNFAPEFQPEYAEQASVLYAAITEKTGVDPYHGAPEGAPKFCVGLNLVQELSPAEFFVGFVEKDFVITAKNKPMLEQALKYVEKSFVTGEGANAGEGYLYLPGKLAYKSPTVSLFDDKGTPLYTIVYPDETNEIEFTSVNLILNATEKDGAKLEMQTDLFSPDSVKTRREILVGLVDREESIAVADGLNRFSYYLGITEHKVIIVATNPWTLKSATERLISLFANDLGKITELPAEFSFFNLVEIER